MNSLGRIPLCVPSKGRHEVTQKSYVVQVLSAVEDFRVIYVVPESEVPAYKSVLPSSIEVVAYPDEMEGNLSVKRNWIVDMFFERVIGLFDDDIFTFRWASGVDFPMVDGDLFLDVTMLGIDLCNTIGSRLFGFGIQAHPKRRANVACNPIVFNKLVSDTALFQLGKLYRDEKILVRSDLDLVCRELSMGFPVVRLDYVAYQTIGTHGSKSGGLRSVTTSERIRADDAVLREKWGMLFDYIAKSLGGNYGRSSHEADKRPD